MELDSTIDHTTGLEITTKFFPLAWFLYFVNPVIEINDNRFPGKWGKRHFELPPGEHILKIYFPYMFYKECGANTVRISLEEGQIRKVEYYMPPWMMAKGRIKEIL